MPQGTGTQHLQPLQGHSHPAREAPKVTLATSRWVTVSRGISLGLVAGLGSIEPWSGLGTGQGIPMRGQTFGVVEEV